MKNFLVVVLCLLYQFAFPQTGNDSTKKKILSNTVTISDIKSSCNNVNQNYTTITFSVTMPDGSVMNIEYDKMTAIINKDIVQFNNLQDTYDSDLKINAYKLTDEYKSYLKDLLVIRDQVMSSYFYFTKDMNCFDKYNINSKTFQFSTSGLKDWFLSTGYLQFEDFCIMKPNCFKYKEYVQFGGQDYFYNQDIFVPVVNQTDALDIENNCKEVKLMFIFKLSDVVTKKIPIAELGMGLITSYIRTKQITKAIIFNSQNDKIYKQYIPLVTKTQNGK